VRSNRLAQSFGIDGRGIDQSLHSDSAKLPENGDRDVVSDEP
jgi:hypothetical protein